MEEGEAIENRCSTGAIESAQKKVEARNFDIRKHLLEYDDVMNKQRKSIYARRRDVARERGHARRVLEQLAHEIVGRARDALTARPQGRGRRRELTREALRRSSGSRSIRARGARSEGRQRRPRGSVLAKLIERVDGDARREKSRDVRRASRRGYADFNPRPSTASRAASCSRSSTAVEGPPATRWTACARASACAATPGKDPKLEYQREGFALFEEMNGASTRRRSSIVPRQVRAAARRRDCARRAAPRRRAAPSQRRGRASSRRLARGAPRRAQTRRCASVAKVGRNDPCPCGSGQEVQEVLRRRLSPRSARRRRQPNGRWRGRRARLPRRGRRLRDQAARPPDLALIVTDAPAAAAAAVHALHRRRRARRLCRAHVRARARARRGREQRLLERGDGRARPARRARDGGAAARARSARAAPRCWWRRPA